jgi:hypothetical protein
MYVYIYESRYEYSPHIPTPTHTHTHTHTGELEAQRRKVEADIGVFQITLDENNKTAENLRLKLVHLEGLSEVVLMLEKQLEEWNLERNRLNEKVGMSVGIV